jgi:hypothetical protein
MKKTIIFFSLLLTTSLSFVFANENVNPDQRILDGFKKEFIAAQSVTWERQGDFDKATFLLSGHRVIAWFNTAGQLEGSIRDIFFDQLPLTVMTAVDKRFADADIYSVREITKNELTSYSITLEAKNKKYTVKVGSSGTIEDVEKVAK